MFRMLKPEIIPSSEGERLIPSIASYSDQGVMIGKEIDGSPYNIRSIKRLMGRGKEDLQELQNTLPFQLKEDLEDHSLLKIEVNGKYKSAIEISADILEKIKQDAESYLKQEIRTSRHHRSSLF